MPPIPDKKNATATKRGADSANGNAGVSAGSRDAAIPYQVDEKMLQELNIRLSHDEAAMMDMERDFQAVVRDLTGHETLGRFRIEYEKLHHSIKSAHENEMKLMGKCRDLHAEIIANSNRITTATRLAQEDQATIQALKKEIEKAWKMLDEAHEREDKAGEMVTNLKMEIANLVRLVEKNASFASGQEHSTQELLRNKEQLSAERDAFMAQLEQSQKDLIESRGRITDIEKSLEEANKERISLAEQLAEKKEELTREEKRRLKLERDLKATQADVDLAKQEEAQLLVEMQKNESAQEHLRHQIREYKRDLERAKADMHALETKQKKLQHDYDAQLNVVEETRKENTLIRSELDSKEAEIRNIQLENNRMMKNNEGIHRKIVQLESHKHELESERELLRKQAIELEKRLENQRIQALNDRKNMEDLMRERDSIKRHLDKQHTDTDKLENQIVNAKLEKHAMELELQRHEQEAKKTKALLTQLEQDRDKNVNALSMLRQEVIDMSATLAEKEGRINDLKRQNEEADAKNQAMKNQLEAMRTERNMLSKNVSDANEDMEKYKRRFKIMNDQAEQLRDQISKVEAAIAKETLEKERVETERNTLKSELTMLRKKTEDIEQKLEDVEGEQVKLVRIIKHADHEKEQMLKEIQRITRERDILGTQVIRRNDELTLLTEKIRILEAIMKKGEGAYKARLEDIRVLKLELQRLSREKGIMARNAATMDEMRAEIYRLNKDLLEERNHCRTLEEELRIPANAHRWRALQGNDPSTYELILKIQTYQRRLIKKTDEVIQIERMLQDKENLYNELKGIMARLPSRDIYEKVTRMQQALQEKTKQIRGLAADVNMYTSMWTDEKIMNERLLRDLEEYKMQYFRIKKIMNSPPEEAKDTCTNEQAIIPHRRLVFLGGGFKTTEDMADGTQRMLKYPKKSKTRPRSQEIIRSKETNVAVVNLAPPMSNEIA